ncbi:hypothetical protein [Leifsonia sp. Leaf264]|uniref:hypothetical protein n=1 Tax=Leifsonia sp. Leaf264 TaxID=1736314 RepID=UPI0006F56978|nr:hypothetical protein [Leifsonia sp. Leaf264]KQO98694.1 hypothetical protein ASF30_11570 [Leifsonia sp. Leaf264]
MTDNNFVKLPNGKLNGSEPKHQSAAEGRTISAAPTTKYATEILPGDILVGPNGTRATVDNSDESFVFHGCRAIETEFGTLYIDDDLTFEVEPEGAPALTYPERSTYTKAAEDFEAGDVIVAPSGNLLTIDDIERSSVMPGCLAVENEFGTLYLGEEVEFEVLDESAA